MSDMISHSQAQIDQAIQEAVAWAELHWKVDDPQYSLRSLSLPYPFHLNPWYTVNQVILSRRRALSQIELESISWNKNDGQLWVYEPEISISDGVSNIESNYFLDQHNCPPWDLWVGYVREDWRNYVLS